MQQQLIIKTALHTQVADRLRILIDNGELKPGTRLNEMELCTQLGVSRTPFREALRSLASEGLIELQPNRGAMVSILTRELLAEILPIMAVLEGLAGRLAAIHMIDIEIETVMKCHTNMMMHYHNRDLSNYFVENRIIHDLITEGSGNQALINSINTLSAKVRLARFTTEMTEDRWAQAVKDHEKIVGALNARNSELLEHLLIQHVNTKGETILEAIQMRD